ncbi:DUF4128 domain-containing protein [Allorhizobium sp. BGMRC 0089]|uniref:phage tail terminator-like protein n=1 Tax=Allorhizobium sonneratiae TaxID=2934936 RepID=UPI002033E183|nr:phage tail terminator-like protein [Allorhizobium sonneratiae]MCM2293034.1 DUF4128 domain-containing protein [Allorhizobium sonneratiae]
MADTIEKSIYQALLVAVQGVTLPTGWQKALPGVSFEPSTSTKFVSFEIHFNTSIETDLSLEMDPIRQGFVRANVMLPKGSAIVDAYEAAGKVRAALRRGTKLYRGGTQVRIDQDPALANLMTGDTHHQVPVTAFWRCYPPVPA